MQAEIASAAEKMERTINYRKVVVTDVYRGSFKFAAQSVDDGMLFAICNKENCIQSYYFRQKIVF